mmetsp:Transcript_85900/g.205872  ORF Transcript_85900/g.205872 Transcript_85900/m.205872 type:complete len:321 (+) Transcript_85900:375-1337(+)
MITESQLVCEDRHEEDQLIATVSIAWPPLVPAVDGGLEFCWALLVPVMALRQRHQGQRAEDHILWQVVNIRPSGTHRWQILELYRRALDLLSIPEDGEGGLVTNALVPQQVPMLYQLMPPKLDLTVVRDGAAIDLHQDVADFQGTLEEGSHARQKHARDLMRNFVRGTQRLVLQLVPPVRHGGRESIALPGFATSVEECSHYLCRNDIADVVSTAAYVLAEGHAGHIAAAIKDRTTTVARVDSCIDLNYERGVCRGGQFDAVHPRHNAFGYAQGTSTCWKAQSSHRLLQCWKALRKLYSWCICHSGPEIFGHGILDFHEG